MTSVTNTVQISSTELSHPTADDEARTITVLPDEILADIFHRVALETYHMVDELTASRPPHAVETLSMVCQRWHAVVRATPAVWSYIWFKQHPLCSKHQAAAHTRLSGAMPVTVDVNLCQAGEDWTFEVSDVNWSWVELRGWLHTNSLAPRLRYLDLRCCFEVAEMTFQTREVYSIEAVFTKLHSVTFHCKSTPWGETCEAVDQPRGHDAWQALSRTTPRRLLSIPNLATLSFDHSYRAPILGLHWIAPAAPRLQSLVLGRRTYDDWDIRLVFFRLCHALEHLEVLDSGLGHSIPYPTHEDAAITFPKLRTLVAHTSNDISWLMLLQCPALETLDLTAYWQRANVPWNTPEPDPFPHILREPSLISIRVAAIGFPLEAACGAFLRRMPNAEHLTITIRHETRNPGEDQWEDIASAFLPDSEDEEAEYVPFPYLTKLSWRLETRNLNVLEIMPNMLRKRARLGGSMPNLHVTTVLGQSGASIMGSMLAKAGYSIKSRHEDGWSFVEGHRKDINKLTSMFKNL